MAGWLSARRETTGSYLLQNTPNYGQSPREQRAATPMRDQNSETKENPKRLQGLIEA